MTCKEVRGPGVGPRSSAPNATPFARPLLIAYDLEVGTRRFRKHPPRLATFLASLGIHVLVLVFITAMQVLLVARPAIEAPTDLSFLDLDPVAHLGPEEWAAAGADRGDLRAAPGASEMVQPTSAPPAPVLPPVSETVVEAADPVEQVDLSLPGPVETGVGNSVGTDAEDLGRAGLANGQGAGGGGTEPRGTSRLIPPSPRGMIMPAANRELRGSEIEVWVFVNEAGRVVADSTRLVPPTPDRGFNEQLEQDAAQWVFGPARQNGLPVAAWFRYTIGLE
ncbi:MAG: hypothetical protein EXR92_02465 [Gemmatimonadetes bacterium]|nr:hypothetical protein [Gemmatimonadota bacterium]